MRQKYIVQWRYRSSAGQMDEGDEIFLFPEETEFFNRDSPGVLVAPTTTESADSPDPVEVRVQEGSPQDRMFRAEAVETRNVVEDLDISPAALKLAQENGVDFNQVSGTGFGGKIVVGDIRRLLE